MNRTFVGFLVLLIACDHATEPIKSPGPTELRTAPAAADFGGQSVSIEPFLWRDFQPISPPDGRPLVVVVRVRAAAGAPLATDVVADSVWVLLDGQAWAARAVQEQPRSATGAYLEVVARNGPKWGPGIHADVVVRLRDGSGGVAYVRSSDQLIGRTN